MTRVEILPVTSENGGISFHAVAGSKQSSGNTAGEALDALTAQLSARDAGTLVVVQSFLPDQFFDASQQRRLAELMALWRTARDGRTSLPPDQQAELETLVAAETRASGLRATALADELE